MSAAALKNLPISILFAVLFSRLSSCSLSESPNVFYERYNLKVAAGMASFKVYKQTDICGNPGTALELQKVRLVNENGWKIDDIEISL